jgi:uncharacterized protein
MQSVCYISLCVNYARILLISGICLFSAAAQTPLQSTKIKRSLPVVELTIGTHSITAEIADNEENRAQGLMFRRTLGANAGMLFIFDQTGRYCFWMKNTLIPLAIAFIDAEGIITDIDEMTPETHTPYCPTRAGRYALEMNLRWFSSRAITPGMKINGLSRVN